MDLWESIDDNLLDVTEEEIQFAKKRLELHLQDPSAGISREELKKKYLRSMGFKIIIKPAAEIDLEEAVIQMPNLNIQILRAHRSRNPKEWKKRK